jgi:hypothetical protein
VIVFILALSSMLAADTDHLAPPPGVLTDYEPDAYQTTLARALLTARNRDVQMVTVPSRGPEEAVYIRRERTGRDAQTQSGPIVVSVRTRKSLWAQAHEILGANGKSGSYRITPESLGRALDQVKPEVDLVEAPIAEETVVLLERLWNVALAQARYSDGPGAGLDGTTYTFADWTRGLGYRGGQVWSPAAGTRLAGLVTLGQDLARYARSAPAARAKLDQQLRAGVAQLLSRFPPVSPGSR